MYMYSVMIMVIITGTSVGHENFDLNPVTGEITLGVALDRETRAEHILILVATDGGGSQVYRLPVLCQ